MWFGLWLHRRDKVSRVIFYSYLFTFLRRYFTLIHFILSNLNTIKSNYLKDRKSNLIKLNLNTIKSYYKKLQSIILKISKIKSHNIL